MASAAERVQADEPVPPDVAAAPSQPVPRSRGLFRAAAVAVVAVVIAAGTAVTLHGGDDAEPRTTAEVVQETRGYAEKVAELIAGTSLATETIHVTPCPTGGHTFAGRGVYELPVPVEGHVDLLSRIRDEWRAQGYRVTRGMERDGRALIAAELPDSDLSFILRSQAPKAEIILLVHTPCHPVV